MNWGIHPNSFTASSSLEFLELVINPPICTDPRITPKSLRAQTSIQFALTLESIWLLRNQVVHNDGKLNHLAIVENLEARVLEHWFILNPLLGVVARTMNPPSWSVPPSNVLKLNVDAALKDGVATLAVVVRNDMGHVINGWAKKVETTDPATVEAAALLWALEIAVENKFTKIVVEGDAKLCIDAITIETTSIPWRIHNLVHSIKVLAFEFSVCFFLLGSEGCQWRSSFPYQVCILSKLLLFL
jgi:hypothetical protein